MYNTPKILLGKMNFYFVLLLLILIIKLVYIEKEILCDSLFKSCAKSFLKNALSNNIVVITAVSNKYMIQIKNYWITSAIPNNFTNIVFIASDIIIYNYCKSFTKYVLMGNFIINQTEDIVFLNKEFKRITFSRLDMIFRILSFGYSVLLTDLDIYLYRNPIPYVLKYNEDIVSSIDAKDAVNAGF